MPEVVEGGEVPGFDEDHAVVGGAPDMGVFGYYGYVFGEFLLELVPARCCFLLVGLCEWSYAVEDEEREYQTVTP